MRNLGLGLAVLMLTGCAASPRNVVIDQRGEQPKLAEAVALAHKSLRRILKDYESMKDFALVNGDVQPITATNLAYNFEEAWMLCVEFNAKNSYGAYTGIKQHGFPMRYVAGELTLLGTSNWRNYRDGQCD